MVASIARTDSVAIVQLTVDLGNQNAKDANCGLDTAATLHLNHDQRER